MASATKTIADFLKDDPNPPKMAELKEFKLACNAEWEEFARQIDPNYESK